MQYYFHYIFKGIYHEQMELYEGPHVEFLMFCEKLQQVSLTIDFFVHFFFSHG